MRGTRRQTKGHANRNKFWKVKVNLSLSIINKHYYINIRGSGIYLYLL